MKLASSTHIAITPAVQDYLRAIYDLAQQCSPDGRVTTSQLAERLSVRPASITQMLGKMSAASPALVDYHKSHGVCLTCHGEREVLAVIRAHRLLESYLCRKLGYEWDEVHEEAHRLEHVVNDALIERLAESLGHPDRDPHGQAIPAGDLSLSQPVSVPLCDSRSGDSAVVSFVHDDDPEPLRYLALIGLVPDAELVLTEHDPQSRLHWIGIDGQEPKPLGEAVTRNVFVERPLPKSETQGVKRSQ